MNIQQTKQLTDLQFQQINQLWNDEYPATLNDRFRLLLEGVTNYTHYFIENEQQVIIAWAVDFEKDSEIRFSIIVDSKQQGKGLGRLLINRLKEEVNEFYGWVVDHNNDMKANGEYYQSPLSFYEKQGFEILHDIRVDTEMLKAVKIKWANHPIANQ